MRLIYSKYLPVGGNVGMTILWWLIVRSDYKQRRLPDWFWLHEWIHSQQQIEILTASILMTSVAVAVCSISAWWMFASIIVPFVIYGLCWLAEIALPPYGRAYRDICFEAEAFAHQNDTTYYHTRRIFGFLKHIINSKNRY